MKWLEFVKEVERQLEERGVELQKAEIIFIDISFARKIIDVAVNDDGTFEIT